MKNQTQQNRSFVRAISLVAIGCWLQVLKTGSSILFSGKTARIKAEKYASFVLWFNFVSCFANMIPATNGDRTHCLTPIFATKGISS